MMMCMGCVSVGEKIKDGKNGDDCMMNEPMEGSGSLFRTVT